MFHAMVQLLSELSTGVRIQAWPDWFYSLSEDCSSSATVFQAMTSCRAIGKTIKVSLSFSSASFTFNGNVVNLGSEVVRPSARVTERMPSIGCVFTPCCWTKLAEMKSWDDPESMRKTASWPSIFPRNLRSSSKWLDRWTLLIFVRVLVSWVPCFWVPCFWVPCFWVLCFWVPWLRASRFQVSMFRASRFQVSMFRASRFFVFKAWDWKLIP